MNRSEQLHAHEAYKKIALRYPHIGIRIKQHWNSYDFDAYMRELFTDDRNGERKGFPEEDLALLHEIKDYHDSLYRQKDVWEFSI